MLPAELGIDTGFVIDAAGGVSKQIDIVIYRTSYHPVFEIGGVKYFLVESVWRSSRTRRRSEAQRVFERR